MPDSPEVKSVPLRRRLFLLAAAGMVPIALMSGIALRAVFEQQREEAARAGLEITRALSIAISSEIRTSTSALQVLASSSRLDEGDLAGFEHLLKRILPSQPNWRAAILAAPDGKPLVHTGVAHGTTMPPVLDADSFSEVLQSQKPRAGYLAKGPSGGWAIPLRVPVMRDGKVVYVVTAAVRAESILAVVQRQRLPRGWFVTVADARGNRIARAPAQEQSVGTPVSATLARLMAQGSTEGTGRTQTTEGEAVYTAYSRLPESGWTVALGVPEATVEAGAWRSLATFGAGIALSIILGGLAATFIARSINRPIGELRDAAEAVGRGEPPRAPATDVREIHRVADALIAAFDERARNEAEREHLLQREQAARTAAEDANRAKDEFLAMLGHELRNPMGAIANAAALLKHPDLTPESRAQASVIIARQIGHLTRLTDDLLDAGRAIMGKIVLQRRPVDLARAAAQALATLRSAGRLSRHRVAEDYEPAWIEADPTRIEQIVSNLVINAVKYTPPGGHIRVSVKNEDGEAVLRVGDDGIGLEAPLASRVFDLFVQGDRDLDRALGGLGIGLTLVRRLAELHGGAASVASAGTDQGSEFRVTLPSIEAPDLTRPLPVTPTGFPRRDILVIEDNEDVRETLQRMLELAGHSVRTADDGGTGVEAALVAPPDVALVDIGLPVMDGYEVARRIRAAEGGGRATLLVAVTGYGSAEDRERSFEAGFDAHLVKPVDSQALDEVLASMAFRDAAE